MMRTSDIFSILLLVTVLLVFGDTNERTAFALPAVAEWKTGDFSIEIKDWDNPLGIEGVDNSGLKQEGYLIDSPLVIDSLKRLT